MRSVQEIENAITRLRGEEFQELLSWLDEYQLSMSTAAGIFELLDAEEEGSESQWLGPDSEWCVSG